MLIILQYSNRKCFVVDNYIKFYVMQFVVVDMIRGYVVVMMDVIYQNLLVDVY